MKKVLFLGINYALEGVEHGAGVVNGFTIYSEKLIEELGRHGRVDVVTDKPDRFPNNKVINLFRNNDSQCLNVEKFWRNVFYIYGTASKDFSRDIMYRVFQMSAVLDHEKLGELLDKEKYTHVILNRHEYFFLIRHPQLNGIDVICCAHDSYYLRKLSYEKRYGVSQPLTHIEKAIENALVAESKKLLTISPGEYKYFQTLSPKCDIELFRPPVKRPKKLVKLNLEEQVNFYFMGVNHFVNRITLQNSLSIFQKYNTSGMHQFHVVGTVCDSLSTENLSSDIILHGNVKDLEMVMPYMHVLLALVEAGSGSPIKIADALSYGHLCITTEFAAESYKEFVGKRIFTSNKLTDELIHEICNAEMDMQCYRNYQNNNDRSLLNILK